MTMVCSLALTGAVDDTVGDEQGEADGQKMRQRLADSTFEESYDVQRPPRYHVIPLSRERTR